MIELTNCLESLLELLVVVQPAARLGHLFGPQADLARTIARIGYRQHQQPVTFAVGALLAIGLMPEDGALQQRAAQSVRICRRPEPARGDDWFPMRCPYA